MATYIQELGNKLLKSGHGLTMDVHVGEHELLAELTLGARKQSVSVSVGDCKSSGGHTVRLLSRACPVRDHKIVRAALNANDNLELGGLCLDTTTNPPVIDVVHNLVAEDLNFEEFVHSLLAVARYADQIEKRMVGTDTF